VLSLAENLEKISYKWKYFYVNIQVIKDCGGEDLYKKAVILH